MEFNCIISFPQAKCSSRGILSVLLGICGYSTVILAKKVYRECHCQDFIASEHFLSLYGALGTRMLSIASIFSGLALSD